MQIRPLTKALAAKSIPCAEVVRMLNGLTAGMSNLAGIDPAFSRAVRNRAVQDVTADIARACRRCGCAGEQFLRAFAEFVERQRRAEPCRPRPNAANWPEVKPAPAAKRSLGELAGAALRVEADASAGRTHGQAQDPKVPLKPVTATLARLQQLRYRVAPLEYTLLERSGVGWHTAARKVLNSILSWKEADFESGAAYWHYRVWFLAQLAGLTPRDRFRDSVTERLVETIAAPSREVSAGVCGRVARTCEICAERIPRRNGPDGDPHTN
jgi:hypothetical protein